MVESNFSISPFCEQIFRLDSSSIQASALSVRVEVSGADGSAMEMSVCFTAPLEFRNSLERSTMVLPFQFMRRRGSALTTATMVASKFSLLASLMNFSASSGATTTAIRSWDSLMAISVPSRPSYFLGTAFRSISRPSVSSPMATETPPAPKSLQRLIMRVTAGLRNRRWSLRSSGALPFCTSAPQCSSDSMVWDLEEPVAPPQPSRPVLPPSRMTMSPGTGASRRMLDAGAAPSTAPISMRFAM